MKKNKYTWLGIIMAIGLLILVGVQFYVVSTSIKQKELTRNNDINRAMTQLIKDLELQKTKQYFQRIQENPEKYSAELKTLIDTINNIVSSDSFLNSNFYHLENQKLYFHFYDFYLNVIRDVDHNHSDDSYFFQKEWLDSLIDSKLIRAGITPKYEYAFYCQVSNKIIYENKPNASTKKILEKGLHYNLYPVSVSYGLPDQFIIYFPHNINNIYSSLELTFYISIIVTFLFITCLIIALSVSSRERYYSELRNDFINNMTHEFNTPLATVSLACEALKDPDVAKSEQLLKSYINIIADENQRLKLLAAQILEAARYEKKTIAVNIEKVNVHLVLEECIKSRELVLQEKSGILLTDFQATNPMIKADIIHLSTAFTNIIDNAIKYCDKVPVINITTKNTDSTIEIRIKDNGLGMSKKVQRRAFEKFYRSNTGNIHDVKGFGLGLYNVKIVLEYIKGTVNIESELKKGTTFIINIPIIK